VDCRQENARPFGFLTFRLGLYVSKALAPKLSLGSQVCLNDAGVSDAVNEIFAGRISRDASQLGFRLLEAFHSFHPERVAIGQFFEDVELRIHNSPELILQILPETSATGAPFRSLN
jgi:hypothetical protein